MTNRRPVPLIARTDLGWCAFIAAIYVLFTVLSARSYHLVPDRAMLLAEQVLRGRLDSALLANTVDTVTIAGRTYLAIGPLQLAPYLPFALVPILEPAAGYVIGCALGIATACLTLPLVRAWGAPPGADRWLATFTALGSLLLYVSVFGDLYYLAHVEAFLALSAFLIEWAGARRPAALGLFLALAFLARATTVLAAVPFGLMLLFGPDVGTALTSGGLRHLVGNVVRNLSVVARFGSPLALALAIYGAYNWARFGSVIEAGYGISLLTDPALEARRSLGLFSFRHVGENLHLALAAGFDVTSSLPFLVPNPYGLSMLLVSPALITSLRAGWERSARVLWLAALLVAVPVFLYYGGGFVQYGFRYSLDFTPFLVALMAVGARRGIGRLDRFLIVVSIVSVAYGVAWHIRGGSG